MSHTDGNPAVVPTAESSKSTVTRSKSWIGFAVVAAVALLIVGGAWVRKALQSVEKPAPTAPVPAAAAGPEQKPAASAVPESGRAPSGVHPPAAVPASCEKDLEEVRKLFRTIPDSFTGLSGAQIEKIRQDAKSCRQLGEAFLQDCRGAAGYHEAQLMVAKTMLWLNRVAWSDFVADRTNEGVPNDKIIKMHEGWKAQYYGRIIELAGAALEKLEPGKEMRSACLDLLGDALVQNGQPRKALERYRQLQEEFPSYPSLPTVYLAMAAAHQDLGSYREGIEVLRKGMARFPADSQLPNFYEWLWKLNSSAGDLKNLPGVVEEMRAFFLKRLKQEGVGRLEKDSCERYFVYSGFQLGYARFAGGDTAGAIAAFQESVDFTNSREKELASQNQQLPPDWGVYRTRCQDNLAVLREKIGRRPDADLQGLIWAGDRKLALDGRPLALVFRNYGEDRSADFLAALDRHARKRPGAFEVAAISFLRGTTDPHLQAQEAFQEAQSLGLECPVGLDPDATKKSLFDAFDATVGSATFVIIDRSGNYAWFQQDPRKIDADFSIAILERIVGN